MHVCEDTNFFSRMNGFTEGRKMMRGGDVRETGRERERPLKMNEAQKKETLLPLMSLIVVRKLVSRLFQFFYQLNLHAFVHLPIQPVHLAKDGNEGWRDREKNTERWRRRKPIKEQGEVERETQRQAEKETKPWVNEHHQNSVYYKRQGEMTSQRQTCRHTRRAGLRSNRQTYVTGQN